MKNKTEIAKELRAMGYKFTQTDFTKDIERSGVIEFQHNHVVLYGDDTAQNLAVLYKKRSVKVDAIPPTPEPTPDQLTSIQKMLEAICKDLWISVPA